MNVLIIEDDAPFARLLGALLNANGDMYHIERAETLAAARERLTTRGFDFVLTDLGLPDSRGLATYQAVREPNSYNPRNFRASLGRAAAAIRRLR